MSVVAKIVISEVNIKEKHPLGLKKNMSGVAKIVIPGVVITGVHCMCINVLAAAKKNNQNLFPMYICMAIYWTRIS